jgi:Helicase conserved C-terminal domain
LVVQNIGFNTVSLRSSMDAGERAATIDRFNDPNSDIDVLTTSFGTSSFGLNLQYSCNNLIIMAVAQNVNLILQIIGRIHRLGQTKIQRVWIVTLCRSYDNFLQWDQTNKMVAQLAGEADVEVVDDISEEEGEKDGELDREAGMRKGKQIRDQCKEMVRRLLGQRTSRGEEVWADKEQLDKPWKPVDEDESDSGRPDPPSPGAAPRTPIQEPRRPITLTPTGEISNATPATPAAPPAAPVSRGSGRSKRVNYTGLQ